MQTTAQQEKKKNKSKKILRACLFNEGVVTIKNNCKGVVTTKVLILIEVCRLKKNGKEIFFLKLQ